MRKLSLLLFTFAFTLISAVASDPRLIGTWKSDKDATMIYLKANTKLTPEQLAKVGSILGKTVLIIDANNITLQSGNYKFTSPYVVTMQTDIRVFIQYTDPKTKQPAPGIFEFDTNSLWACDDRIQDFRGSFVHNSLKFLAKNGSGN